MKVDHRYILASQSPRRRALLEAMGMDFEVLVSGVDERAIEANSLRSFVMQAAAMKAQAVRDTLPRADDPRPIIAADTMVALENTRLGKPENREEAHEMLRRLSAKTHQVLTGLALSLPAGGVWLDASLTEVTLKPLSEETIRSYVESGASDDKAGAYGIQEIGTTFLESIRGDLSNVIGLPLICLRTALAEAAGDRRWLSLKVQDVITNAFPSLNALPETVWAGVPD